MIAVVEAQVRDPAGLREIDVDGCTDTVARCYPGGSQITVRHIGSGVIGLGTGNLDSIGSGGYGTVDKRIPPVGVRS